MSLSSSINKALILSALVLQLVGFMHSCVGNTIKADTAFTVARVYILMAIAVALYVEIRKLNDS